MLSWPAEFLSGVQAPEAMVTRMQRVVAPVLDVPQVEYCVRYWLRSRTEPRSPCQLQRALPAWPFLVVITMTPLAASVPYSVAAEGPFTISMSEISSGFSVFRSDTAVPPVPRPRAEEF